jgi:hypothetical protein
MLFDSENPTPAGTRAEITQKMVAIVTRKLEGDWNRLHDLGLDDRACLEVLTALAFSTLRTRDGQVLLGGVAFDTARTPHPVSRTLVVFALVVGTLRTTRVIIVFSKGGALSKTILGLAPRPPRPEPHASRNSQAQEPRRLNSIRL